MMFFKKKKEKFKLPVTGKIIPLEKVNDPVFSKKSLGDGFAIEIEGGKIYAPFSGVISLVYPTHHAYGIKNKKGTEILIHIGMDTVNLNGEGLEAFVKEGDKINQGDLIASIDIDSLKNKGYDITTPVIFVSGEKVNILKNEKCLALQEDAIEVL